MTPPVHAAGWRDVPGWAALERGLDRIFKAFGLRFVLVLLAAVTWVAPEAPDSEPLFNAVRGLLDLFALSVALRLAQGFREARRVPPAGPARPLLTLALAATVGLFALDAALTADAALPVFATPTALQAARFASHTLLLATLALTLGAALAAAPRTGARALGRPLALGLGAVVALAAAYVALHLSDGLTAPSTGRTLFGLAALATVALALFPLHRLARHLHADTEATAPRPDLDLHAAWDAVEVAERLPNRARPAATRDGAPEWSPRAARLTRLTLAGRGLPPLPHRAAWLRARDGLRLFFGGFAARATAALVALIVPLDALGGGALALLVGAALAVALAAGALAQALGLWRAAHIPTSSGARTALLTGAALAAALVVADAALLARFAFGAWFTPSAAFADTIRFGAGALALLAPLALVLGVRRLAGATGEAGLRRRALRPLPLALLLAALLILREVLQRLEGDDAQGVMMATGLTVLVVVVALLAQVLRLAHDAAEAIDDHVARADRLPDDAA